MKRRKFSNIAKNVIDLEIKALQRIKELNNGQKLHRQDRKAEIWERQTRKA